MARNKQAFLILVVFVVDELEELVVGDEVLCDFEWGGVGVVAAELVVPAVEGVVFGFAECDFAGRDGE